MPSGPPELHEYWCEKGPWPDGDHNAMSFLKKSGFVLTDNFFWRAPSKYHVPSEEENKAINYLCWEWDFGGILEEDEEPNTR